MSDEKRLETPGSQPTGDSSGGGSSSSSAARQSPADTRRGGAAGEVNNSNVGGGGRHGSRRRHRSGGERENQSAPRRPETSINMDELRELADLIAAQGFTEFELEKEGFRLRLSRNIYSQSPPQTTGSGTGSVIPFPAPPTAATSAQTQAPNSAPTSAHTSSTAAATAPVLAAAEAPSAVEDLYKITSPIVGTFYRAPSPTSDVFVNQGSRVEAETVVCIIEAMKLMNEIQAEVSGTIEKIYVENGQPVEYGQALFGVKR
ncbi:MAG TPA: acetyl-CoA carboxylase biotin carboxyl carrier protein [Pyrinomonadaceae bacterium]|jgi:acetyl-CoA carboxylase biotin carboxyl carrier protein